MNVAGGICSKSVLENSQDVCVLTSSILQTGASLVTNQCEMTQTVPSKIKTHFLSCTSIFLEHNSYLRLTGQPR